MALDTQTMEIPFGGLETKLDPRVVPVGKSLALENVEWSQPGVLRKRAGHTALTKNIQGGGTISAGRSLFTLGSELLLADGTSLYAWSPTLAKWVRRDNLPLVSTTEQGIGLLDSSSMSSSITSCSTAIIGTIQVVVWAESGGAGRWAWYAAWDTQSGAVLAGPTQLHANISLAQHARVVASGTTFFVVSNGGIVTPAIYLQSIPLSTLAASATTTIAAVGDWWDAYDLCAFDNAGTVAVAWAADGAVKASKATSSGLTGSTLSFGTSSKSVGIAKAAAGTACTFVYFSNRAASAQAYCKVISSAWALGATTAAGSGALIYGPFAGAEISSGTITWVAGFQSAASTFGGTKLLTVDSDAAVTVGSTIYNVCPISAPWLSGGQPYFCGSRVAIVTTAVVGGFVIKASRTVSGASAVFVAKVAGIALPRSNFEGLPSQVVAISSKPSFIVPAIDGAGLFRQRMISVEHSATPMVITGRGVAQIASGSLWDYAGGIVSENNFAATPEIISLTQGASGSLADGVYIVKVCYECVDSNGRLHRSQPSVAATITIAAGGGTAKLTAIVRTAGISERWGSVVLFSTAVNGTTYYRRAIDGYNSPVVGTISQVFGSAPASGQILYTDDGTLDFAHPDQLRGVVQKGQRLYGVTRDGVLWYTHEFVAGEPAEFSEYLTMQLLQDGGSDYGIAVLDDSLVVFGEYSIQVINGNGPSPNGSMNDLSTPRRLPVDNGYTVGTPLVTTDDGVWYHSSRGINILTRALASEYIGSGVDHLSGLTPSNSLVVPLKNQVRFGHSDGATAVFDYLTRQWTTFTNQSQVAACVWNGAACWLTSDGTVYVEDTTLPSDVMVIETPWLHMAGMQDYHRVRRIMFLGEWRSAHSLKMELFADYSEIAIETVTFDATTGYTAGQRYQLKHVPIRQKVQAMKIKLTEMSPAGTKESFAAIGLSLSIGVKKGMAKLSSTERV